MYVFFSSNVQSGSYPEKKTVCFIYYNEYFYQVALNNFNQQPYQKNLDKQKHAVSVLGWGGMF